MKLALRDGDTLARLGGDEFVAVLIDLDEEIACVPLLQRLLGAVSQPVAVGELSLELSASLGVTFYPQGGEVDADQLMRQADQAMYQAKVAGKNRYHVFDSAQDRSVRGRFESLQHIKLALSAGEFVLHYQPKVNMRSGAVIGAEALIRWQHPQRGLLPPAEFLSVIEDTPLAVELGEWVIDTALAQKEQWCANGLDLRVSVNVGARQLQQVDFVDRLKLILDRRPDVPIGSLEIEVLETSALQDVEQISQVIRACRALGVTFALDDFGTGYSSLTYLKRLPVAVLKVDQSFVRDMLNNLDDLAILEAVLGLATAFRRTVIAEGVETTAHGEILLQLGCELAQGFGIARPMPGNELVAWVASWRPDAVWSSIAPARREDLPLVYADVDHQTWVAALENYLKDLRSPPRMFTHTQCRFGIWLHGVGLEQYGASTAYKTVEHLHHQVHKLSKSLLELKARGKADQALLQLETLHALRKEFRVQLKALAYQA
jgi:EAL domain-containing protein (putative c-di-GMP-specific phosphodiesterase class I)